MDWKCHELKKGLPLWTKVIGIADLHLLDPDDPAADCASLDVLLELLEWVDDYDYLLVILGDLFEGWHGVSYKKIVESYRPFFERLARMKYSPRIVIGNHDRLPWGKSMAKLMRRDFGLECRDQWVLNIGGCKTLCIHGDQFDSPNKKGRKVGWLVTRVTGWLERNLWKDLDLAFYRLKRNIPALQSKVDYPFECVMSAEEFSADAVWYGHTHKVYGGAYGLGWMPYEDDYVVEANIRNGDISYVSLYNRALIELCQTRVLNPGSWVDGERGYIRYCDGKWTLGNFQKGGFG